MKLSRIAVCVFCFAVLAFAATPREVYSNSTVHLSWTIGTLTEMGSGFILVRPDDPSKVNEAGATGQGFLVTNKHVLPPEGQQCTVAMRATTISGGSLTTKTITIPIVGADGKYLKTVHIHPTNDVAAVLVTPEIIKSNMRLDFVPTTLLGTKERIKSAGVGLVGDEVYILGYPAGLYDPRNANPLWRIGIVASSPLLGYAFPEDMQRMWHLPSYVDGLFLIDSQVYPGSSGSMVVNKPQPTSFDDASGLSVGGPRAFLSVLGIVSDSIPILDSSLRLVTRMGMGVVQSADVINETIEFFYEGGKHP